MPYRVDVARATDAVLDRLVELGALDVDRLPGGGVAALMPDGVAPEQRLASTSMPPRCAPPLKTLDATDSTGACN